jgi:hypothetical protein
VTKAETFAQSDKFRQILVKISVYKKSTNELIDIAEKCHLVEWKNMALKLRKLFIIVQNSKKIPNKSRFLSLHPQA